jgi:hypothetical protein
MGSTKSLYLTQKALIFRYESITDAGLSRSLSEQSRRASRNSIPHVNLIDLPDREKACFDWKQAF